MGSTRKFTFEERKQIEELLKEDASCSEISRRINRSKNGVVCEVRKGGGKIGYTAKKGQQIAHHNESVRKERLRVINIGNTRESHMKKRIENLEMQIEILADTLKELMNDK